MHIISSRYYFELGMSCTDEWGWNNNNMLKIILALALWSLCAFMSSIALDESGAYHASILLTGTHGAFAPEDVFVHLHIPKTGGSSFGQSLLRLDVKLPCVARHSSGVLVEALNETSVWPGQFQCLRQDGRPWLFSRYTVGWPCGVHASLDRLQLCVPNQLNVSQQRLLYVTFLRHPVERVISEFLHHPEGWSRWNDGYRGKSRITSIPSDFYCNGTLRAQDLSCDNQTSNTLTRRNVLDSLAHDNLSDILQHGQSSSNMSLWDYLACPSRYPHNRQTRMLALSMPCHQDEDKPRGVYERLMLTSAMKTLKTIPFFGLSHRRWESERLFEWTFGVRFRNVEDTRESKALRLDTMISDRSRILIEAAEYLDMELWKCASYIFDRRLGKCGAYCRKPEEKERV